MNIRSGFGVGILFVSSVMGNAACGSDAPDRYEPKEGFVRISNTKTAAGGVAIERYSAEAGFTSRDPDDERPTQCFTAEKGTCTVTTCTPDNLPSKNWKAGLITVRGGSIGPELRLVPSDNAKYPGITGQKSLWSDGDEIEIDADGAPESVGSFVKVLKAPSRITVSAPVWPAAANGSAAADGPTIDRFHDLDIAWLAAPGAPESGEVRVIFSTLRDEKTIHGECFYSLAGGKGQIPSAMLSLLPAGKGDFSIVTENRTWGFASGWNVLVSLESNAAREGGIAAGEVTFL